VLGIVAYFFLGRDFRRRAGTESDSRRPEAVALALAERRLEPVVAASPAFVDTALAGPRSVAARRIEATGRREGGMVPLPAYDVTLYFAGADKFRDLLADLRGAETYIHLMYLIWEKDELTAEVTAILLERMDAGVEVNVIYDWLSSLPFKKDELEQLAKAGARVVPCYKKPSQLNYRNHMKMAIIDRHIVYSGGMNMGQEYVDGGSRFPLWRDTHFRLTGPVTAAYLSLFGRVWRLDGRGELPALACSDTEMAGAAEGVPVQVLHSSVSTRFPTIRDAFLVSLATARSRVWIQSPYFVPDEPLLTGMCVAAASGIDVRLMITGIPDKKIPFHTAHSYFGTVLASGVRVFTFEAGFLHAKTVTVDDELAVVGTCNWDIRSLILHDEVVAVFYDAAVTRTCAQQYERDLAHCGEYTSADLATVAAGARLRNHVCRLFSRLL
jgi:cardiolipin synthase A/B